MAPPEAISNWQSGPAQSRAAATGTRETQKAARRRKILDAARALILEGGRGDFSMPALAAAAGVSLVTPYNLFGSKANILLEIARQDIFGRMSEIADLPCDSLAEFLSDLAEVLARVYYNDRHFYRRMIATMTAQESAEGQQAIVNLSYEMFEPLTARLLAARKLRPILDARILARQFAHSVASSLQHRMIERGSEARLKQEFELGLILIAAGLAPPAERTALLDRAKSIGEAIG
jgi:AcrR family transcriptional regulator